MRTSENILNRQNFAFGNTENGYFWRYQNTDNQYRYNYKTTPNSTGKELDAETGYSYFGARYLDHALTTVWLSVDPMADKYPSISPYAYCAWNPLKLVDPKGREMWKPEILFDGTLNYVAEKGDNAKTLREQYGLSKTEAEALFKTMSSDGRISGKNVASITKTHSEILKYDVNYKSGNNMKDIQRRVYHVGFACLYNKTKQNGRAFKLNEFFSGLLPNYSGIKTRDGWGRRPSFLSIPAFGGGEIPIRDLSCQSGGDVFIYQDGGLKQTADYNGYIMFYNQMQGSPKLYDSRALSITFLEEYEELINKSYRF